MAAESQVYKGQDHQGSLIPQKFLLIIIQFILLIILVALQQNHIYWYGINKVHSIYSPT